MEIFLWLKENVAVAQFFAYTSLTVTTAIVAVLSLRFSYRQHYGWRPILLLVNRGLKGGTIDQEGEFCDPEKGTSGMFAWIVFDLWNRRTYPIVLESVTVTFSQDILDYSGVGRLRKGAKWRLIEDGYKFEDRFVLDNGKHHSFNLNALMAPEQSLDRIDCTVILKVQYFDPRRHKSKTLVIAQPYNFHPATPAFHKRLLKKLWPLKRQKS